MDSIVWNFEVHFINIFKLSEVDKGTGLNHIRTTYNRYPIDDENDPLMARYVELLVLRWQLLCYDAVSASSRVYGPSRTRGEQGDIREIFYACDLKSIDFN